MATVFPGPKLFSSDHLGVWMVDPEFQTATEMTEGGDYEVTRLGMPSSTVTMTIAPPTGSVLLLLRTLPLEQRTRFRNQGQFYPELHEDTADEGVMIDQQQQDMLDRVLRGSDTDVGDTWNFDAQGRRIINLGDGINEADAVNLGQMRIEIEAVLAGGPTYGVLPQYWEFDGDGVQTDFTLPGAAISTPEFYDVFYNRVPQEPYDDYSIILGDTVDFSDSVIRFVDPPANGETGWVVLRGYARPFTSGDPVTGDMLESALRIPIVYEADTAFDITETAHQRALIVTSNAAEVTATLDENAVTLFISGDYFSLAQGGDGAVTVDVTAVTVVIPEGYLPRPRAKDCVITFTCEDGDTNTWRVSGEMAVDGAVIGETLDGSLVSEPVNALASASGVLTIDCSLGSYFTFTPTENVTSTVLTNVNPAQTIAIRFTQHASAAKTWAFPALFDWAGGTVGVVSTGVGAVDLLTLTTFNSGTAFLAALTKAYA